MDKANQKITPDNKTLYIALEQSIAVQKKDITIGDIATIFCANCDISFEAEKIKVFSFTGREEEQQVVSIMKLIQLISCKIKNVSIESIGSPETIVYYKNTSGKSKITTKLKAGFLILVAFLGAGFSIMSYNTDITVEKLLINLHELYIGEAPSGPSIGMFAYSIGLLIGVIIFFNHGIMHKLTDDPTPLQVQMRLYEQDVNQTVITDSKRNNKTLDVK